MSTSCSCRCKNLTNNRITRSTEHLKESLKNCLDLGSAKKLKRQIKINAEIYRIKIKIKQAKWPK